MRQRAGAWELRVYAGRDPISGKKRWTGRTVKGGKREAQRALAELVAEAGRQQVVPARATVGELLEQWFAHARADFSPKTVRETRGFLDRNLLPTLGPLPLARLRHPRHRPAVPPAADVRAAPTARRWRRRR